MALSTNLIAAYHFDETSGNPQDSSGSGFHLTNTGTATFGSGKIRNATILNGTSQYHTLASAIGLTGASQNYSFSGWFKPSSTLSAQTTFFHHADSVNHNDVYFEYLSGNARLVRTRLGVAADICTGAATFTAGVWYHIACTYDGTTLSYYINGGSPVTLTSTGNGTTGGTAVFQIGSNAGGTFFPGMVDEFCVWSRAITQAEVMQLYNSGIGLAQPFTEPIYATWNPSDKEANITLSNGNLTATSGTTLWRNVRATIGVSTGKWYWEIKTTAGTTETMYAIGTAAATLGGSGSTFPGSDAVSYGYYGNGGNKFNNNTGVAYGTSTTTNDIIGIALDMTAGTLTFYKNGTSLGQAYSGISGTFFPMVGLDTTSQSVVANFGATPFAYPVPSGYNAGIYSGTYDKTYLTSGMVAAYHFDEASGNASDSISTNTLTNNGTTTFTGGKFSNAADFGATNTTKYFNVASALVDTSTSGISSVGGWVNITTAPSSGTSYELYGAIKSGGRQFEYRYENSAGTLQLSLICFDGTTAGTVAQTVTLTTGTWYHVMYTVNQNTVRIYLNGVQLGTTGTITAVANGSALNNFTVGRHPNASAAFSCSKVDESGVWSKELNALDIQNLYNSGNGIIFPFSASSIVFSPAVLFFFLK